MNKIYYIGLLVSMSLLAVSCGDKGSGDDNTDINNITNSISPLKIGNTWEFIDSIYSSTGVTTRNPKVTISGSDTIIVSTIPYVGYFWNWYSGIAIGNTPVLCDYKWVHYNDSASGLWVVGGISSFDTLVSLSHKIHHPVDSGDVWTFAQPSYIIEDSMFVIDSVQMTCIKTNYMVNTPAGNFPCNVYKYRKSIDRITAFSGEINYRNQSETPKGICDVFLYYSENVGYVAYVEMVGAQVTLKRLLSKVTLL